MQKLDAATVKFIAVTAVFSLLFGVMLALRVSGWVEWTAFIVVWTLVEWRFVRGVRLTWRHWALLIGLLSVIDIAVIWLFGGAS